MRPALWIASGLLLVPLAAIGGVYLMGGRSALEQLVAGHLPSMGPAPKAQAAQVPPPPASMAGEGKILFYRDPMGLPEISPVQKKDSMGMDYIPVYDTPTGAAPTNEAPGGKGKVLYYRNPMGLPDISYEPKKDSMGMDYIPVYENEAQEDGNVVRISLDKVQKLGVATEAAAVRRLTRTIRATGTLQPDESRQTIVTARFDGWVQRLHVDKTGDMVKPGQAVLELFSPSLRLAQQEYILARRTDPALAAAAAQRLKTLGLTTAQISALEDAREAPGTIAVIAPEGGQVVEKMAVEGARIMAGEPLYRLVDFSHVWVIAEIYEQDLPSVQPGLPVEVELDAFPGERFQGEVSFIYPNLTPETRTAKIRVELGNADGRLKADMYAAVLVSTDMASADVLSVPESAILDTGRRRAVLVERGEGRYEPREVRLGRRADGHVEILEGLTTGEKVVVSANFLIDAESNLQAALRAFTAGDQPAGAPQTESQP
ncbi:efflux RND transporter periplasmic adaptor subunit [Dongia deserti]|uniref:efflux RND transporter periplasmic adaptor subunit n=1 Tax=Dongia deserti TaxID=2268030 RepID=UPI000E6552B8|nr:efflux RND transporter periplasmic adaptor subunit [Dongia deserti]